VDYSTDMKLVESVLKKVLEDEPLVIKDESVTNMVVFKSFNASGVTYTVKFWAERETFIDSLNAVALRIKKYFDEYGISIPFTIVEVRNKN